MGRGIVRVGFVLGICGSLAACAILPRFITDELAPSDIIRTLRCEIRGLVIHNGKWNEYHKWLQPFKAQIGLHLSVVQRTDASGDVTLAIPLNPDVITPKLAGNVSASGTRTIDVTINKELEELAAVEGCHGVGRGLHLEGKLGLDGYLDRLKYLAEELAAERGPGGPFVKGKDNRYGFLKNSAYTVNFYISATGTASARYTMVPIGKRTLGANASLGGTGTLTHRLVMTVTPPDVKTVTEVNPIPVYLVDDPSGERITLAVQIALIDETIKKLEGQKTFKEAQRTLLSEDIDKLKPLVPDDRSRAFTEEQQGFADELDEKQARVNALTNEITNIETDIAAQNSEKTKLREKAPRTPRALPELRSESPGTLTRGERERLQDGEDKALIDRLENRLRDIEAIR